MEAQTNSCFICHGGLKDPLMLPCGHKYCKTCVNSDWDGDQGEYYSCPQCRKRSRPGLNTRLTAAVEEPKKSGVQAAPADRGYTGAEDVACDVCTGRKRKALKSCLECRVTFCEKHLQPHRVVAQYKKHQLVNPSKNLQENICSRHDEVIKMFCRSDEQCICYLCSVDEHKGHDIVLAEAERREKQSKLMKARTKIMKIIRDKEQEVKVLQQEVTDINLSAEEAVKHNESFAKLLNQMVEANSDVQQQITSLQEGEVRRVQELQEKLEQEITELRSKDAELQQLSHTEDHCRFLLCYSSASDLDGPPHSSSVRVRPCRYFGDVTAAVSGGCQKLQDILPSIVWSLTQVDALLPVEPKTREEFLEYSYDITLDPNTADTRLVLSEENRRATWPLIHQPHPDHPDRFLDHCQVLSRQSLAGRHYWEVEWSGLAVDVAVAYKNINRDGEESKFGYNDKSWALYCNKQHYVFRHNSNSSPVSRPHSSTVGVYLDHRAGLLSFYSVSDTTTLLHTVQTSFTEPLHAGLRAHGASASAVFCKRKPV